MTTSVNGTIDTDVPQSAEDFDSGAAFLKRWEKSDAETPSDQQEEKPQADKAPQPEEKTPPVEAEAKEQSEEDEVADAIADEDKDADATNKGEQKRVATDDDEVTVTVDGQEHKVAVKDLKRLWGQEAALTKKSQEVSEARKKAEQQAVTHVTALSKLMERAQARLKEFEGIDFLVAQQEMEPEDFKRLRAEASRAYEEFQYIQQELQAASGAIKASRAEYIRENAPKALEEIKKAIPDWNTEHYNALRSYAVQHGVEKEEIDMAIEPSVFILLDKAYRYDKAKALAAAKKAKAKTEAAKKVAAKNVRTTHEASNSPTKSKALERLRKTGNHEDAAEAFLDRWTVND